MITRAHDLKSAILEAESPFKVGDVIEWAPPGCSFKVKGRITAIIRHGWQATRILKNGKEGRRQFAYHWQNPVKIA